jgi:hypothetical protein
VTLALAPIVAALRWNPTVRGILFPAIMFLILCGSSYFIMATNMGNRLGFLVANAALWGWICLMALVWMFYGIGPKGRAPAWKGVEAIQNTANAQDPKVRSIPNTPSPKKAPEGWRLVPEGSPTRGDASAAVDAYLKAKTDAGGVQLVDSAASEVQYKSVAAYETGGDQYLKIRPRKVSGGDWYNPADYRWMGIFHGKRLYVEQIQFYKKDASGAVAKDAKGDPVIDPSVTYSVVEYRDLGSLRQPPFVVFLSSGVLFAICCVSLHKRDKKVMRAMSLTPARA